MTNMKRFYEIYMNDARNKEIPTLFVRFEDLVMDPEPELRKMMAFMLGLTLEQFKGTNAERRVKEVVAMGSSATVTYTLKDSTKKYNSNAKRYSKDQIDWIKGEFKEMLHFFGYAKVP